MFSRGITDDFSRKIGSCSPQRSLRRHQLPEPTRFCFSWAAENSQIRLAQRDGGAPEERYGQVSTYILAVGLLAGLIL